MRYIWQYDNWSDFHWQADKLIDPLANARFCQGSLLSKVRCFDPAQQSSAALTFTRQAQAEIMIEEAVKTAAIEGQILIARALSDMALAQDEHLGTRFYSLSSQIMAERDEYYRILEHSQKGDKDITSWLLWFTGCFKRALNNSEKLIADVLAKADFWRRNAQTPMSDRQRKAVNRLLDAGYEGFEGGLTTRKYVSMTKTSRATAYREISDLVIKGILKPNHGKGRNVSYSLNWTG
jgi:Fic family protein